MADGSRIILKRHVIAFVLAGMMTVSLVLDSGTGPGSGNRSVVATARGKATEQDRQTILARLPATNRDKSIRQAARDARSQPDGSEGAAGLLARAGRFIATMRAGGSARLAGYAETLLSHQRLARSVPARVMLADLYQYQHRFDDAEDILRGLRVADAGGAAVWLLSANVARVQGRLDDAMAACLGAERRQRSAWTIVCKADLQMLRGDSNAWQDVAPALAVLDPRQVQGNAALAGWLGDMADRAGDEAQARRYFSRALVLGAGPFVVDRYARFLIDRGELEAAQKLVHWWQTRQPDEAVAGAVNEVLLASARGDTKRADRLAQRYLSATVPASEASDLVHWRELTRLALATDQPAQETARLAQENWARQKEPIDAWLMAKTAMVHKLPALREQLRRELAAHGMQGVLADLAAQGLA